jgi:Tol biopolymer transport system component
MKLDVGQVKRVAVYLAVACLGLAAVWLSMAWLELVPSWPLSTSPRLRTNLKGHTRGVAFVAYSPDGKTLASGSLDKTIKLWDVATGKEQATLKGHTDGVRSVAYSPDGKTLASGSDDQTIKLWDVATGKEQATLQGPFGGVEHVALAFSPDGETLASGSWDQTILNPLTINLKLWDVTTGKERATLKGHSSFVFSVAFSPDGKTLASGSGGIGRPGEIKLWDVQKGNEQAAFKGQPETVSFVTYSPDGKTLASASWDGTIKLWDVAAGTERATLRHGNWVESVAFSPDGKTLASEAEGNTIKLWDVAAGTERATLKVHTENAMLSFVAYSPDGKTLASASWDGTIKLWDVTTGKRFVLGFLGMLFAGLLNLCFRRAKWRWKNFCWALLITAPVVLLTWKLGLITGQRTEYVLLGAVVGILCIRGSRPPEPIPGFRYRVIIVLLAIIILGPVVGLMFHYLRYLAGVVTLYDDWEIRLSLLDGLIASIAGLILAAFMILVSGKRSECSKEERPT